MRRWGPLLGLPCLAFLACVGEPEPVRIPLDSVIDSASTRELVQSSHSCLDCIELERVVTLGDTTGPGMLTNHARGLTRDRLGNYWLGIYGEAAPRVFGADGAFIAEVGRQGDGPLEFREGTPVYVDTVGNIHVVDTYAGRESVVSETFELVDERPLGVGLPFAMIPHPQVDGYVINAPNTPEAPLVITETGAVRTRFGAPQDNFLSAQYAISVGPGERLITVRNRGYTVEVWTPDGNRVTGMGIPNFNPPFEPGRGISAENPPTHSAWALRVDSEGRAWVLAWIRRSDWLDRSVQVDGRVAPQGDDIGSWYQSRLDVIDLETAVITKSQVLDRLFTSFLDDDLIVENVFTELGHPQLVIWKISERSSS